MKEAKFIYDIYEEKYHFFLNAQKEFSQTAPHTLRFFEQINSLMSDNTLSVGSTGMIFIFLVHLHIVTIYYH